MRRTLYWKLLLGYLLFGILSFILVSTFTMNGLTRSIQRIYTDQMYKESVKIASSYAEQYYSGSIQPEELHTQLAALSTYLGGTIQIVQPNGQIMVDSSNPDALSQGIRLEEFDIGDFGQHNWMTGSFYGMFQEPQLSVFAPISRDYRVRGYVIIHMPMSQFPVYGNELLNVFYLTLLLIFVLAFVILLIFTVFVYRPIRRMSSIADAYIDGDFSKSISIHTNDEIGHLAAAFDYMANELNTLEEDQRKFVSNVSHDFRSPLTSIKGYLEAILDGTIPTEFQEKYLNIMLFETERLNKLTSGLLELNKYGGHGKTILDISDFDINYIVRMTARTFEGICRKKNIAIELVLSGQTLYVTADLAKIQQVIYNLTDNAIKFSHDNSSIKIETTEKNEKVFVSVKDTGIGIPGESLKKIWERFYKTDSSRGKDKRGTGLGLSIVKEIITAHNENINVISTEGVGTEFIFTLPLAGNQPDT